MNALESQNIMFLGGFFWSNMLPPSDSATTDEEVVTRVLRRNTRTWWSHPQSRQKYKAQAKLWVFWNRLLLVWSLWNGMGLCDTVVVNANNLPVPSMIAWWLWRIPPSPFPCWRTTPTLTAALWLLLLRTLLKSLWMVRSLSNFVETDSYVYTQCNTSCLCDTETVTVTVRAVHNPPDTNDDSTSTRRMMTWLWLFPTSLQITNDSDPDLNALDCCSPHWMVLPLGQSFSLRGLCCFLSQEQPTHPILNCPQYTLDA